ncbi:hypothetical protein F4806DRAFT_19383 [Annulohypoxylon nitens]|nr:hypothetical protein F4806DRAFT_19383 [Annulohypoxylon nitens]
MYSLVFQAVIFFFVFFWLRYHCRRVVDITSVIQGILGGISFPRYTACLLIHNPYNATRCHWWLFSNLSHAGLKPEQRKPLRIVRHAWQSPSHLSGDILGFVGFAVIETVCYCIADCIRCVCYS